MSGGRSDAAVSEDSMKSSGNLRSASGGASLFEPNTGTVIVVKERDILGEPTAGAWVQCP